MKRYNATLLLLACVIAALANSPYINKVYEYTPAPGQFINTPLSYYEEGDTYTDVLEKVNTALINNKLVTLGAYGGYVVVGFDHTIANVVGEYDFKVYGNAIVNGDGSGSSEPGIVMVSADTNGDGLPNDEWYEIAGSMHGEESTLKNYRITYYRPNPVGSDVQWVDSNGDEGYVPRVSAHAQGSYYPQWTSENTLTFKGSRLPGNATFEAPHWKLRPFEWGYADNQPNTSEYSNFNIEWAVKKDGSPANLRGIDFIKIYTGVVQVCGSLGETSTEVGGIEDLHPDAPISAENTESSGFAIYPNPFGEQFSTTSPGNATVTVYNLLGNCVLTQAINAGSTEVDASHLSNGYYTVHISSAGKSAVFRAVKK